MATAVEIKGVEKVLQNFRKLRAKVHEETTTVIRAEAERVVERARELAPVKTGALRDTIRFELVESRNGPAAELRVGGGAVDYAAQVHEEHPTGRKFLQRPVLEVGRELPAALKKAWLREIEGKKL